MMSLASFDAVVVQVVGFSATYISNVQHSIRIEP